MTQYKITFTTMKDFTSASDLMSGSVTNSSYLKNEKGHITWTLSTSMNIDDLIDEINLSGIEVQGFE